MMEEYLLRDFVAGAPATLLEVYVSFDEDHGVTALTLIVGVSLLFSALLKQAMTDANKLGKKDV